MWSSVERFSTQGISFLFTIFLARMLSPSDYGAVAMLSIFMAVSQVFIDSGFASALIRKKDCSESDYSTVLYFNISVSVGLYVILFISAPLVAEFYKTKVLTVLLRAMGTTLIFNALCIVQQAILTAKIDFKTQTKVSILAVTISGIAGLSTAYLGYGIWALVVQAVSLSAFRAIFLWLFTKWRPVKHFSGKSFNSLFSYGSKLLISGLLDTTYSNMYPLVIGKYYTSNQLGSYSRALSLCQFPSSSITGIIQRVFFPVFSSIQNEDERLKSAYIKCLKLSAFLIFPLMLLVSALSKPLILCVLTKKWLPAVPFMEIICFDLMWYPIHAINLNLLEVKGRSDYFLKLEVIKKVIGISILILTLPHGVKAMCWGMVASSLLCLIVNTHYTNKIIHIGFLSQMRFLLPICANSFVAGAIALSARCFIEGNLNQIVIGGCAAILYYAGINILLKTQEAEEIISFARKYNG